MFRETTSFEAIHKIKNAMNEASIDPMLIDELVNAKVITNYETLFHKFIRVAPSICKNMTESWQWFCLSGEEEAFNYAKESLGINNKTVTRQGETPLHYAALSGNTAQLKRALNLGFDLNSRTSDLCHVLHFAILSNEAEQVRCVLNLQKQIEHVFMQLTLDHKTSLHFAAATGKLEIVEMILELVKNKKMAMDIHALDDQGFNALNYAIEKGNQGVIRCLKAQEIVAQPKQEECAFSHQSTRFAGAIIAP
jgi:ankyrin repeat protein